MRQPVIFFLALILALPLFPQSKVTLQSVSEGYVLGPGDQFSLEIPDLEELNGKVHRIDGDGTVNLPLVGRIKAAGMTLSQFEAKLDEKLSDQLKEPHITVTVTETLSAPVTVLGSVNTPGVHQIKGNESLAEVISLAGGLKPDAGYLVTVTRKAGYGTLPLKDVSEDKANNVFTGTVNMTDIIDGKNPAENIRVMPNDVITVPRAKLVYVIGEVKRSGGFTLEQHKSVSILQVLALAEGLTPSAAKNRTIIMRQEPGAANRTEIRVDLGKIMSGKENDVALLPEDILFVPNSIARQIRLTAIQTAVSTGTGILIWRGL